MNKERLLTLADFLENLEIKPDGKQFDMAKWDCGTSACALGWACTIPEFNKAGLTVNPGRYSSIYYNGSYDSSAAADFFHITNELADWLFMPSTYPEHKPTTPKMVAKRIRLLVEEYSDD